MRQISYIFTLLSCAYLTISAQSTTTSAKAIFASSYQNEDIQDGLHPSPEVIAANKVTTTFDRDIFKSVSPSKKEEMSLDNPTSKMDLLAWLDDDLATLRWKCSNDANVSRFEIWLRTEIENEPIMLQVMPFINSKNHIVNFEMRDLLLAPGKNVFQIRMIHRDDRVTFSEECEISASPSHISNVSFNTAGLSERLKLLSTYK